MNTLHPPVKDMKWRMFPYGDITQWFGVNRELYSTRVCIEGAPCNPAVQCPAGTGCLIGHNGIDIVRPWGSHLFAVEDGVIFDVKDSPTGYGKHIRIYNHENAREWVYGHMADIAVKDGDDVKGGDFVGTMGNCFDKETEILTEDGWKLFSELTKKEKVATLNRETQEIEYHLPTHYTERKEKEIFKFSNYHSLDFAVTADHPMWVELQDGKMHTIAFENLPKYSWVKQSGGIWKGEEMENYVIGEKEIPMDTWLDFLGWFWSDGHTTTHSVRITQSFNNEEKREIIEGILERMPYEYSIYEEDYAIHSKDLVDEISRVKAIDSLPLYLFNLSSRQIRIFLDAYWGGDGWMHKSTKYYISPNKLVAGQLQELIMKCGGYATIKEQDPTKIKRTKPAMIGEQEIISTKPYWVITEGKHRMAMIKKDRIEKVEYNDKVYCVTVENHIIYVRRNGRPMWCHNTGFVVSGHTPFWGHNPYAGTHLHLGMRYHAGGSVQDYTNGYFGALDFLHLFRAPELLSTKMDRIAEAKKSHTVAQFADLLRVIEM